MRRKTQGNIVKAGLRTRCILFLHSYELTDLGQLAMWQSELAKIAGWG